MEQENNNLVVKGTTSEIIAKLSEKEQEAVLSIANQIDIKDSNLVIKYGSSSQHKIEDFSSSILEKAKTKDLGTTGSLISGIVNELNSVDVEKPKGFLGLFKKGTDYLKTMKTKYTSVEKNVDEISKKLKDQATGLVTNYQTLDNLYEEDQKHYKELSLYIAAGKIALEDAKKEKERLALIAETSGLPEDIQALNDYVSKMDRFSKKLNDLEITRTIALQMAPQIRLLQANDWALVEKIESTINNTIPLWKTQLILALGTEQSLEAAETQRRVTEFTNKMLRENADKLQTLSIQTAKENERAIVDIETLKYTNKKLIDTLSGVLEEQNKGRENRAKAEQELASLELELKEKILSLTEEKSSNAEFIPNTSNEDAYKLELKL